MLGLPFQYPLHMSKCLCQSAYGFLIFYHRIVLSVEETSLLNTIKLMFLVTKFPSQWLTFVSPSWSSTGWARGERDVEAVQPVQAPLLLRPNRHRPLLPLHHVHHHLLHAVRLCFHGGGGCQVSQCFIQMRSPRLSIKCQVFLLLLSIWP